MADINITVKVQNKNQLNAKQKQLRQEASRLVSMANKRLKRLEEQNEIG